MTKLNLYLVFTIIIQNIFWKGAQRSRRYAYSCNHVNSKKIIRKPENKTESFERSLKLELTAMKNILSKVK